MPVNEPRSLLPVLPPSIFIQAGGRTPQPASSLTSLALRVHICKMGVVGLGPQVGMLGKENEGMHGSLWVLPGPKRSSRHGTC